MSRPKCCILFRRISMKETAKCKKCGRVLKSAISIARGMGPICAGVDASSGKSFKAKTSKRSGKAYAGQGSIHSQSPLFPGELPNKRLSKRELHRRRREERRRLFQTREPIQCGVLLPKRKPLVYTPLEDGSWQENPSGRIISHERLQQYLVRYRFI
jgi:hypothetical protein